VGRCAKPAHKYHRRMNQTATLRYRSAPEPHLGWRIGEGPFSRAFSRIGVSTASTFYLLWQGFPRILLPLLPIPFWLLLQTCSHRHDFRLPDLSSRSPSSPGPALGLQLFSLKTMSSESIGAPRSSGNKQTGLREWHPCWQVAAAPPRLEPGDACVLNVVGETGKVRPGPRLLALDIRTPRSGTSGKPSTTAGRPRRCRRLPCCCRFPPRDW
jgi:hypothetical protein